MRKLLYLVLFVLPHLGSNVQLNAQANEVICSQRYKFCFQIPPNHFMLTTNDIESSVVSYRTIDGSSTIAIVNGSMTGTDDFHRLYLMVLGQWTDHNYRIVSKKEYPDFFVISGYTRNGRGFYQKVLKIEDDYVSAYLEFPRGNKKYSNVSQLLFDHFGRTVAN